MDHIYTIYRQYRLNISKHHLDKTCFHNPKCVLCTHEQKFYLLNCNIYVYVYSYRAKLMSVNLLVVYIILCVLPAKLPYFFQTFDLNNNLITLLCVEYCQSSCIIIEQELLIIITQIINFNKLRGISQYNWLSVP